MMFARAGADDSVNMTSIALSVSVWGVHMCEIDVVDGGNPKIP